MSFKSDQHKYASLIKALGGISLKNNKTISEFFILQNKIPLWDMFAPELAWRHLTILLASRNFLDAFKFWLKPILLRLKAFYLLKIKYTQRYDDTNIQSQRIICLALTPRMYFEVLAPIVEHLAVKKNQRIIVLTWDDAIKDVVLKHDNITYRSIWSFWDGNCKNIYWSLAKSYKSLWRELRGQRIAIENLDVDLDFSSSQLRQLFRLLFKGYIPATLHQAAIATAIFKNYKPSMIISSDVSDARVRLYSLMAKSLNIPTFDVQFGLTGDEAIEWCFFQSDYVATWGAASEQSLIKLGVEKEKIVKHGSPRHDMLVNVSPERVAELKQQFGLDPNHKIILLASTFTDPVHNQYASRETLDNMKSSVFNSISDLDNVTMIVKPHPHEDVKATQNLNPDEDRIIFIDKGEDIRHLIIVCDVFISFGSTATIDALIANKPCICPVFPDWPFSAEFEKTEAVSSPKNDDDLKQVISHLLNAQDKQSELTATLVENLITEVTENYQGDAAAKISQSILNQLKNSHAQKY